MATNVYMKITDENGKTLDGNSTAKGHEKQIEVVSWSHGFSQPTTAATKSADQQAVSRANHMDLNFTKFFDNSSDDITKACWTGAQMKEIILTCHRASGAADVGSAATDYLIITMEDVIISNYSISGGGDELPIENVTLNYTKIKYSFKPVSFEDGKAGSPVHITHDLSTNEVS
jgi:type VI secretion system secreted protein Hcp